jgi:hypothetical protein
MSFALSTTRCLYLCVLAICILILKIHLQTTPEDETSFKSDLGTIKSDTTIHKSDITLYKSDIGNRLLHLVCRLFHVVIEFYVCSDRYGARS